MPSFAELTAGWERRPGTRSGGSWRGCQEVGGLDRVSACGNLLFSSLISAGSSETGAAKKPFCTVLGASWTLKAK